MKQGHIESGGEQFHLDQVNLGHTENNEAQQKKKVGRQANSNGYFFGPLKNVII